jgi:hypothetical protein
MPMANAEVTSTALVRMNGYFVFICTFSIKFFIFTTTTPQTSLLQTPAVVLDTVQSPLLLR